jgi:hypothetical protein
MLRKIKTKYGIFYYCSNYDGEKFYTLFDSDKKFITNFNYKETIKLIENVDDLGELVDILALQNITWGNSMIDLLDNVNDWYNLENENEIDETYDFINRVGTTYFTIDFE